MKLLLENWRKFINESKLRVFDFDDTIAKSDSKIYITTDTGRELVMTPGQYATHKVNPDYEYDFSEFDEVINPREIKQITNIVRNALNAGTEGREIAILTARAPEAEEAIRKYLESLELDTSKITFVLLGDSDPQAKAAWVAERIEAGATDVLFFDDSGKNVDAVESLSEVYPEVKIKARKVKYAEDIAENTPREA
jgi:FMN phosphatase YigB (HAD superfamily)